MIEEARQPLLFVYGAADAKFAAIGHRVHVRAGAAGAGAAGAGGSAHTTQQTETQAQPRGPGGAAPASAANGYVEVEAVEGAAHAVLEEQPAACGRVVGGFLQRVLAADAAAARGALHEGGGPEPAMIASANVRSFQLRLTEPLQLR